jgi:putative nucleotidyltransferase with HDIG domain
MGFEEMIVQLEAEQNPEAERLEQLRRYFQEVSEQYKLPPLPMAVTTALQLVRNDYTDLRQLTRVLSNDAALAGRILSLARSPIFGLQRLPRTLQEAIPVLGLLTLRRILLAAGTQMLYAGHSKASQALWNHSLATALASQLLADRSNKSGDQAFLTGLLHDVGLMVTVHSYEAQFERLQKQLQEQQQSSLAWEHRLYHTDHTIVGAAVLYRWHLDRNTIMAVFGHHKEEAQDDPSSLESLIRMANFLAHQAGLGFLTPPVGLSQQVLEFYGCETEEEMESVCATVTRRFTEEKSLFS